MRKHLLFVGIVSLLAVPVGSGKAQTDDNDAILISAAARLKDQLPAGLILIDPDLLRTSHGQNGGHTEKTLKALQTLLGGRIARINEAVVCPDKDTARSCRVAGGIAALALSSPRIEGDSEFVSVVQAENTGLRRIPVAYKEITVVLVRHGKAWRVERTRIESQT